MTEVSFGLAFGSGVLSFLSPCILPLVPVYVSVITGLSNEELQNKRINPKVIFNSLSFVAGFSTIFLSLGLSSSIIGGLFDQYQDYMRIAGGILTIIFGLFVIGLLKSDFLIKEKKIVFKNNSSGIISAFLIGFGFAAGWTPCIGPILGTILIYAGIQGSSGFGLKLLFVYSLGLAIPFLISAIFLNLFIAHIKKFHNFMKIFTIASGLILIAFGIMLLTNNLKYITKLFI